jgi:hypothetical protein
MKRNISSGLSISHSLEGSDGDVQMREGMESSMEFTDKGSMLYKGFKINQGGVQISPDRTGEVSPFMLNDIRLLNELGRWLPWIHFILVSVVIAPRAAASEANGGKFRARSLSHCVLQRHAAPSRTESGRIDRLEQITHACFCSGAQVASSRWGRTSSLGTRWRSR